MTNVLIVSPTRIHCRGFRSLLENKDGIRVIGGCRSEEATHHTPSNSPDVVLLDVTAHPEPTVIGSILGAWPGCRIIVLGVEDRDHDILFWMEHGASHFVTTEAEESDLLATITETASGQTLWSARISSLLLQRLQELAKADPGTAEARLTPREREILDCHYRGLSNREIAKELSIEPVTVKNHFHRILKKAHTHNRSEAVARFKAELTDRNSKGKT